MTVWIGVLLAGAVGAPTRLLVDGLVQDRTSGVFPWGTFVVNMAGSFVLGLLTGAVLYHAFPDTPRVILGTGFAGRTPPSAPGPSRRSGWSRREPFARPCRTCSPACCRPARRGRRMALVSL